MCKVCSECKGVMNYDSYFQAEVCTQCGKMERAASLEVKRGLDYSKKVFETNINIMKAMQLR